MTDNYNKVAAISILVLVLLIVWLLIVMPYLNIWREQIRSMEILHKKYTTLTTIINNKELFTRQYLAINNDREFRDVFLDNKSGALADIKLQGAIQRIIEDSEGRVIQLHIKSAKIPVKSPSRTTANDKSVTVEVLMQGSIRSIYAALQKLENNRLLMVINNFEIINQQSRYQSVNQTNDAHYRAKYDVTAFIQ